MVDAPMLPMFAAADVTPPSVPLSGNPRQAEIDAALEHADKVFRDAYNAFALAYAASHGDFTGEDISTAYRSDMARPQPREWRAVGGIVQRLIRNGVFEATGEYRLRANHTPTAVYRRAARWG